MPCLDGMRAIATLWVVATHFTIFSPPSFINELDNAPGLRHLAGFFYAGCFGVDTFFVLSAMLAANKMFHEISKLVAELEVPPAATNLQIEHKHEQCSLNMCMYSRRNGRLNIPLLYLQRILRLSPILIVITLFHKYLLQFCANGPAYNNIDGIRYTCENNPWYSLLYISNYVRIEVCRKFLCKMFTTIVSMYLKINNMPSNFSVFLELGIWPRIFKCIYSHQSWCCYYIDFQNDSCVFCLRLF